MLAMALRISGKTLDVGDALRSHIDERIESAVGKYFDGGHSGHVVLEREGPGFKAECTVHLDTGVVLQAEGKAQEARAAFELAADRIDKRLRRYKRRLKDHSHPAPPAADLLEATDRVFAAPAEDEEVGPDYSPVTIAEETTSLMTLSVSTAVVTLDMSDRPVLVFRNAGHGGINVVYRRADGNIGWIDPALPDSGDSA
jgi:ribosomal subunit interface protein